MLVFDFVNFRISHYVKAEKSETHFKKLELLHVQILMNRRNKSQIKLQKVVLTLQLLPLKQ